MSNGFCVGVLSIKSGDYGYAIFYDPSRTVPHFGMVSWPRPPVEGGIPGVGLLSVRDAEIQDLDAILGLYEQLAEDRAKSMPVAASAAAPILEAIITQRGRALLVADCDGRIAGTADMLVVTNLTHRGMPWAIVENVVVDERQRGRGVGRALMDEIIHRSQDAGCYKIQLLSREHREGAHAFYQSLGFHPSARGFRRYLD